METEKEVNGDDLDLVSFSGIVVAGYGAASGERGRVRSEDGTELCPSGTLQLQFPLFQVRGLDLSSCHPGTINIALQSDWYPRQPFRRLCGVDWWPGCYPPEAFSFFRCFVSYGAKKVRGYIYFPDPATKISEFQPRNVMEILCPYLSGIRPGISLHVEAYGHEVGFIENVPVEEGVETAEKGPR